MRKIASLLWLFAFIGLAHAQVIDAEGGVIAPKASGGGGGAIVNTKCSASPGALHPNYFAADQTSYTNINGGVPIPANTKFWMAFTISRADSAGTEPTFKLGSTSGLVLTKAVGTLARMTR